nr:nucleotide-binding alpha-beta plait domain-containing protein [Tanacetum cinerariifolium]
MSAKQGGKTSGFFTNNIKKNVNSETANIKSNGFSGGGNGNSYVGVVKGVAKPVNVDDKTLPAVELDDNCLLSRDLSNSLLCRVKEFASLANLQRTLSNEGFMDVKIQYMGEFWVMLEFASQKKLKMFQTNVSIRSWFSDSKAAYTEFQLSKRIAWIEKSYPLRRNDWPLIVET